MRRGFQRGSRVAPQGIKFLVGRDDLRGFLTN